MRAYDYKDINEVIKIGNHSKNRFQKELNLYEETNMVLLINYFKCAKWIEEHYPALNWMYHIKNSPFRLVVENGKTYFEKLDYRSLFTIALSRTETAVSYSEYSTYIYGFLNTFFFHNDGLELFLLNWDEIKEKIIKEVSSKEYIYGDSFEP